MEESLVRTYGPWLLQVWLRLIRPGHWHGYGRLSREEGSAVVYRVMPPIHTSDMVNPTKGEAIETVVGLARRVIGTTDRTAFSN